MLEQNEGRFSRFMIVLGVMANHPGSCRSLLELGFTLNDKNLLLIILNTSYGW